MGVTQTFVGPWHALGAGRNRAPLVLMVGQGTEGIPLHIGADPGPGDKGSPPLCQGIPQGLVLGVDILGLQGFEGMEKDTLQKDLQDFEDMD